MDRLPRAAPVSFSVVLFLGALVAWAVAPPAAAQDPAPDAPPATAEEARDLLLRAMAEVEEGRLEEAIGILEPVRGWSEPPPQALAVLGALYVEADRPEEALAVLGPLTDGEDAPAAVLYNAGRAALAVGQIQRADRLLARSVELEPGTPAARELGLLRGSLGAVRDAYRLLVPWARSHPEDEEARRAAALAALRLRRVPTAEELLAELPQTEPENKMLWGHLLILKGEPHGAVSLLAPLLPSGEPSGSPDGGLTPELETDVRQVLTEAYVQIGEAGKAVEVLEGHVTSAGSALLLARARYQSGDLEGALATLAPLAEPVVGQDHDPDDPRWGVATEIVREYGRWLVAAGRPEEAIPYLEIATEREPGRKETWQALGQALAGAGRREEARDALAEFQRLAEEAGPETERTERARLAREDPTAAALERARRLVDEGRREEALELVHSEAEVALDDPRPRLFESWLLLVMARPDQALEAVEEVLARYPESSDALHQRGAVLLALDRPEEAEAAFRRALELAPGHVPTLNDLAILLIVQGERAEARELLERVLEIRPEDERAKATLERLRGSEDG